MIDYVQLWKMVNKIVDAINNLVKVIEERNE